MMRFVGLLLVGLALAVAAFPVESVAAPIIRADSVVVADGSTGNFLDVFLDVPAGESIPSLSSFTIDLMLGGPGITITNATHRPPSAPYALDPNGGNTTGADLAIPFFPPGSLPSSTGVGAFDSIIIGDGPGLADTTLGSGTFSLARIFFDVALGTGPAAISVTHSGATGLSDDDANPIDFATAPGLITVLGQDDGGEDPLAPVPEPLSVLTWIVAACGLFGSQFARRGK